MNNSIRTYISKLFFNNGESLDLKENDIVLFVGPNNAGKSQSLNDIYTKCQNEQNTIVVSGINIEKGEGSLLPILNRAYKLNDEGRLYSFVTTGYGKIGFDKTNGDENFKNMSYTEKS
jgi:ABC-type branched-subunit amino acid transport system ATPase component